MNFTQKKVKEIAGAGKAKWHVWDGHLGSRDFFWDAIAKVAGAK